MNYVSVFMAVFAVIGGLDLLIGNRFGIGKEFEKGFQMFGNLALAMIGMIVIAPLIGAAMGPVSNWVYENLHIDPSLLPTMLFANDMGGAVLAAEMAKSETWALFNGLIVSAMMGCTLSFTIPVALSIVKAERQKHVLFGFLCGIATIPFGCLTAGLLNGIPFAELVIQLLPLILLSVVIALGLIYFPKLSVKIFGLLGSFIKILIIVGLILGIIRFLTGVEIVKGLETLEEGASICVNACVVMSGAFPFLYILSKLLTRPLRSIGKKLGIDESSAMGFISSLATSLTTYKAMEDMDEKGIVLNSAFAISGAFTFAGHLAFTLSYKPSYLGYVMVAKMVAAVLAVILAGVLYKYTYKKHS